MSQLSTWRAQLTPARFLVHSLSEVCRKLLNPAAMASYSQYGEDKLIWSLVGQKANGRYVDVGCHHPMRISNTYFLYLRGWSGITIDANQEYERPFARVRPRDKFIRACVSDKEIDVNFTIYKDRALSSLSRAMDGSILPSQMGVERIETLRYRRLDDILSSNEFPSRFDLLSVDVENHDFAVISSIDLEKYRPQVIAVESHDVEIKSLAEHPMIVHLQRFGYSLAAFQGPNLFFRQD